MERYKFRGNYVSSESIGFQEFLKEAYDDHLNRPLCVCCESASNAGIPMSIAKVRGKLHIKSMPGRVRGHAKACSFYEPPSQFTAYGVLKGTAITFENEQTHLKLGFTLSGRGSRSGEGVAGDKYDRDPEKRLGISALLHYLWDQAQLNKCDPKSSATLDWNSVSERLLVAAADNNASRWKLEEILYVPRGGSDEPARLREFKSGVNISAKSQKKQMPRMLIISEFKSFDADKVSDYLDPHTTVFFEQGINFPINEHHAPSAEYDPNHPESLSTIYRNFKSEIELLRKHKGSRLILIATLGDQTPVRIPGVSRLALHDIGGMLVDANWLPFEDENQKLLLDELRKHGRDFWVTLKFNLPANVPLPAFFLTDTRPETLMYIESSNTDDGYHEEIKKKINFSRWTWNPSKNPRFGELPKPLFPGDNRGANPT